MVPFVIALVVPLGLGGKGVRYMRAIVRGFLEVI